MARTKGSLNKNTAEMPRYCALSVAERVQLLANLIVDRIEKDQLEGAPLLKQIQGQANA